MYIQRTLSTSYGLVRQDSAFMRGGRLRRKSAMYGRGDGTLTYREYIGDIIGNYIAK